MSFDPRQVKVPITFGPDGDLVTIEQDSRADIVQCMWACIAYELGERLDAPDFGISDQALKEYKATGAADIEEIGRALARWEPRAAALISREPNLVQQLIERIGVRLEDASG